MTLFVGYTLFYPDPDKYDEISCNVCGSKCLVERNVERYTSFASAMSKKTRKCDYFYCPHHEEEWHEQALKLARAIRDTPSKKIKAIIQEELDELIEENLNEK